MTFTRFFLLCIIVIFSNLSFGQTHFLKDGTRIVKLPFVINQHEYDDIFISDENLVYVYTDLLKIGVPIICYSIENDSTTSFVLDSSLFGYSNFIWIKKLSSYRGNLYMLFEENKVEKIIIINSNGSLKKLIYNSEELATKERHLDFEVFQDGIHLYRWIRGEAFDTSIKVNFFDGKTLKPKSFLKDYYPEAFTAYSFNYKSLDINSNNLILIDHLSYSNSKFKLTEEGDNIELKLDNWHHEPKFWTKYLKYTKTGSTKILDYFNSKEDEFIKSERVSFINDSIFCINYVNYTSIPPIDSLVFFNFNTLKPIGNHTNAINFGGKVDWEKFNLHHFYYNPWDINSSWIAIKEEYSKKVDPSNEEFINSFYKVSTNKLAYLILKPMNY